MKKLKVLAIVMFTLSLMLSGKGVAKVYADEDDDIIWGNHVRKISSINIENDSFDYDATGNNYQTIDIYGTYGIKYKGTVYNPQKDEYRDLIDLYIKVYANNKVYGRIYTYGGQADANIGPNLVYYYMVDNGTICESYDYVLHTKDLTSEIRPPSVSWPWNGSNAYIPETGTAISTVGTISVPRPWDFIQKEADSEAVLGCALPGGNLQSVNGYNTQYLAKNMVLGIDDAGTSSTDMRWYVDKKAAYIRKTSTGGGSSESISPGDKEDMQNQATDTENAINNSLEQEKEYTDNMENQLNDINIENSTSILDSEKMVNSMKWIRQVHKATIEDTEIGGVVTLILVIGLATYLIGRTR